MRYTDELETMSRLFPGHVWATTPDGVVDYLSPSLRDYTGITVAATSDAYRAAVHADDLGASDCYWASLKAGRNPGELEIRLRRADGAYRWFICRAQALKDKNGNGQTLGWIVAGWDIDEFKRAQERLRQTQTELARATKIATVAELSASIAHELNQPLTSVIANAQACKRWLAASPPNLAEARASVDNLLHDARSADETMRRIRGLFERHAFRKSERNVKDMILEAVRLLRQDESKAVAEFEFDLQHGLPPVCVDQIQIQQVLINLISNGIEATDNTGRSPRIAITARSLDERSVLLEIMDNGSGIIGGDSIFDPFVTTKAKGLGIGLAVSRSIIEAHEGRLIASNNAQIGATFSVVLPVVSANAAHHHHA